MNPPSNDPTCDYHESAPAVAVCADCGADICGACHDHDERGFALCPSCRGVSETEAPDWEAGDGKYTPRAYVETLWKVLRHPRMYLQRLSPNGESLPAVVFGFISMTFGLLVDRIWKFTLDTGFQETLTEYGAAEQFAPEELRVIVFLATPLSALFAGAIHIGALKAALQIAGGDASWKMVSRIGGYALGAYLFLVIPPIAGFPVGHLLAVIWLFNLEASALQSMCEFDPWKATLTVMVPAMLLMTCGG